METDWTIAAILGLLGIALAGLFGGLWRRADQKASAATQTFDQEKSAHAQTLADLRREKKSKEKLAEEIAGYRKRTEKTKKRQSKTVSAPLGTQSRIQDLEDVAAQLRREKDGLGSENEDLKAQMRGLEATLTTLQNEKQSREEAIAKAEPMAAPAAALLTAQPEKPAEPGASGTGVEAELAEAKERIDKLENEIGLARATEAKMRKRMANQEQLYASVRSELDVKKDRLRTQEEQIQRLQALEVAISSD